MNMERSTRKKLALAVSALTAFVLIHQFARIAVTETNCPGDVPTNTSVVTEYTFSEGSGTNTFNAGTDGEAGDVSLTNGVTFSTNVPSTVAVCGFSVLFPNTGSGSSTPAIESATNYDPLAGATSFTLMAWVKRESAASNNNTSARIVSDTSSTTLTNTTAGFEFRFSGTSGTLALRVNGKEVSTSVGGIPPNEGSWHHVAVVFDSSRPATNTLTRNVHFYADGVQRGDGNVLTNTVVSANTNRLTIGNSSVSRGVANAFVGKLDDSRILREYAPNAVGDGQTNAAIVCYRNAIADSEPPTITCAANVTTNTDPGQCSSTNVVLENPAVSDDCGIASLTNNAPATFGVGGTLVIWTATDLGGNSSSCTQIVTVVDNQLPSISCPANVTVNTSGGGCSASNVSLGQPTVSDNCGIGSVTNDAPATFAVGTNVVTWTVTDVNGNGNSCQQQVIVIDSQAPVIACPSNLSLNADQGACSATGVNLGQPTVADNCGVSVLTNDAPGSFPVGTNIVTWVVVDANGTTNTCQQSVVVADNQLPTITCPGTATFNADPGQCSITNANLGQPTVSDNCAIGSTTNDAPAAIPVGTNTVTWTTIDVHGNSRTCEQTVIVVDATQADDDGDGIPTCWESAHGLNGIDPSDANKDADGDGFTNYDEYWMGTDPQDDGSPATLHVDASYTGTAESGTFDQPFKRIQSAIDAASTNEVTAILVRPGTYNERPYATGKASLHFFSVGGPLNTIIDGQQVNSSVMRIYDFSRATLRGFTIRNARTDWLGAGLRIEATNGVILVANNIFTDNVTTNTSSSGGGGGMYVKTADGSRIVNNFITKNSARRGGGVLFAVGNVQFWHNTIADNEATTGQGGGVSALQGIKPDVRDNILWGNIGTGTVAQVHSTSTWNITNNVVQGGYANGTNNLTGDPQFVSPFLNDYHIRTNSSARNAAVTLPLAWDADNEFRPEGSGKDIGADEFWDADSNGLPESWQQRYGLTSDPNADPDNDSLSNLQEYGLGTHPLNPDTDGDTISDGCEGAYGTNPFVAETNPGTAGSNGPICANDTLQLSVTNQIGGAFSWTGPNGFASTNQNPQITNAQPSHSGVYFVTETAEGQAPRQSCVTVTVSPFPSPAITTPSEVCPGFAGVVASVPDAGEGAAYAWTISNGAIQDGQGTRSIKWKAPWSGTVGLAVAVISPIGCTTNGSFTATVGCPTNAVGLRGEYYDNRDFTNLKFTRLDPAINFNWGFQSPDPSMGHDDFSVRWTGQFIPQYSETYTFFTQSDTGVRVWVNDQLVIDDWIKPSATGHSGTIALTAGQKYNLKVEYYETFTRAYVKLYWSSASLPQQIIPFNLPIQSDSDLDGLTDDQEQNVYGTNPSSADTDGDGVSDYDEIKKSFTNPTVADFDGTSTDVVVKNGSETNAVLGQWQANGTELYAIDRRGHVEYTVTLSAADVYRVEVEGREQKTYRTEPSQFDLQLYVDGEYLGGQTLVATTNTYGKVHVFTPWLLAGSHTIRVFWDNGASLTSLRIKSVRVQSLGGPDANQNSVKDWVETRLSNQSSVDNAATSYTSPSCVEGNGRYLSMMVVEAAVPGGSSTNLPVQHGPGHRWFANIPLSSNQSPITNFTTLVVASHQNGGLIETGTVTWVAKNILPGGAMTIRKNDSVLLTAAPEGATNGTVTITVGTNQYSSTPSTPVPHLFSSAGTFTVLGSYNSGTEVLSNSISVKVIEHAFTTAPVSQTTKSRLWDNFAVPAEAVFDGDPRLLRMLQMGTLTNDGRRVSLLVDLNEPRAIVSRIGTNGPILNAVTADGFQLFGVSQTYSKIIETYADGSKLVEALIILSRVPSNAVVKLDIIVAGVIFEDGTISKELEPADFDALGQYKLRFIKPASVTTANCHTLKVLQGTTVIGGY